jgi:hypothetical protein
MPASVKSSHQWHLCYESEPEHLLTVDLDVKETSPYAYSGNDPVNGVDRWAGYSPRDWGRATQTPPKLGSGYGNLLSGSGFHRCLFSSPLWCFAPIIFRPL